MPHRTRSFHQPQSTMTESTNGIVPSGPRRNLSHQPPPGKAKKAPADTGASGEAVTTPSKGISQAPTAESTESTNSADPVSNSTPQPRAPSERKQSKRSYTSNDDFDPMDCNRKGAEWHNQWWMCGFGETIRDVLKGRREPGKKPTSRSKSPKAAEIMKARRGEC